jgi:hypothetical protein
MVDQKQLENVEYFSYSESMITNDEWRKHEIESRIIIAKSSNKQKEEYFYQKTGLKFKEDTSKMLHLEHSYLSCCSLCTSKWRSE